MTRRPGRPAGASDTKRQILAAARDAFATSGYDGATIRGVARAARVDPALVHHYFGTKEALFVACLQLPVTPSIELAGVLEPGVDGLGERLVAFFLSLWESPAGRIPLMALLRSAMTQERAAAMLRGFVGKEILGRLAAAIDAPAPELRATLVGSQLIGLALARYVIKVEPLASADVDTIVATVGPTIQRYLTEDPSTPPAL